MGGCYVYCRFAAFMAVSAESGVDLNEERRAKCSIEACFRVEPRRIAPEFVELGISAMQHRVLVASQETRPGKFSRSPPGSTVLWDHPAGAVFRAIAKEKLPARVRGEPEATRCAELCEL